MIAQHTEKALGVANTRQCNDRLSGKAFQRQRVIWLIQTVDLIGYQRHTKPGNVRPILLIGLSLNDQTADTPIVKTCQWLAQRAGWQQRAVTNTPLVKDHYFEISCQCQMLQAIISNQDIDARIGSQQSKPGGCPLLTDIDRKTILGIQQGFITHISGGIIRTNSSHTGHTATVATTDDTGVPAHT